MPFLRPRHFRCISLLCQVGLLTWPALPSLAGGPVVIPHVWIQTAGGDQSWAVDGNWASGLAPLPVAGDTVDFSTANLVGNTNLALEGDRTATIWKFGDSAGGQNWSVAVGGQMILAGTNPVVEVVNNITTLFNEVGGSAGMIKAGAGTLILANSANPYSGGTTIEAGRVEIVGDGSLGDPAGGVTFTGTQGALLLPSVGGTTSPLGEARVLLAASGAMAVIARPNLNNMGTIQLPSPLTGPGGFQFSNGYQLGSVTFNASHTNNVFQGALRLGGDYTGALTFTPSAVTFNTSSFADGPGYGNIQFGRGNGSSGNILTFAYAGDAASDLVLDHRRIELGSATESAQILNNSANHAILIHTDLLVSRAGNKKLMLNAAANSNRNRFAGDLADGSVGAVTQVIGLEKLGTGMWALGGTNTYTGATVVKSGTLIFQGRETVSPGTAITLDHTSGTSGVIRLLDDGAGTVSLPNTVNAYSNNSTGNHGIFVGNTHTDNGGHSSATTSGTTVALAELVFSYAKSDTSFQSINVTGANGYRLRIESVMLNNLALRTAGAVTESRLNASTANLSVGDITMAAGNTGPANDGVPRLVLTGSATGNEVTGTISDPVDATSGQPLSLTKNGVGVWTLLGTNTYTGVTMVGAGKLLVHGDHSAATGTVTVAANATLGGRGTLGGETTLAHNARLEFHLSTSAAAHDRMDVVNGQRFTFAGASTLTVTGGPGAAPGLYTLVRAEGGVFGDAPVTVNLPPDWAATVFVDGKDLLLEVTSTGSASGYALWQAANGTSQLLAGDHDLDGVGNGIEWFVHGNGNSTGPEPSPGVFSDLGGLTVTWTRSADYPGEYETDFVVETADAPEGPWTPELLADGNVALVGQEVRYTFPAPLPTRKYAQLKVQGP